MTYQAIKSDDYVEVHSNYVTLNNPETGSWVLRRDVEDWCQEELQGEWTPVILYKERRPFGQRFANVLIFCDFRDRIAYLLKWSDGGE